MKSEQQIIAEVLIERLPSKQLHEILEGLSDRIDDGYCPLCEAEEVPVDREGKIILDDNVSMAVEYQEQHYESCLVAIIERYLQQRAEKGEADAV